MYQTDRIIRLVHLLPALAAAAHKALLQIIFMHAELLHAAQQLIALLGRNRQGERKGYLLTDFYFTAEGLTVSEMMTPLHHQTFHVLE